jgi:hypothetical protein
VSAIHIDRNQSFLTHTDEQGRFRYPSLPVGLYRIRIAASAFDTYERTLLLTIGQVQELPVVLRVGIVAETVDVVANAQAVETVRTQVGDTILPQEIDSLPLNGRNYLDLALLVPGVSRTNTGNNERFAETSAVPGTGISVAGQRNLGNSFIVDGLSANDDAADLAGAFFSQEVIRELQVVRSGGIAEFGRASSGIVNVATQSGTNDWRGKFYGFLRNHRFDAANIFAVVDTTTNRRIKSPLTQAQYGVSLGGPVQRDRTFVFVNFEREELNRSGLITISPANAGAINAFLDQANYPSSRVITGAYPAGSNRTNVFAKVDFAASNSTRIALRYSLYDIYSPNARGVGGLNALSRATLVDNLDQTAAFNAVSILSNSALNETRVQFTRSRFAAPGNDLTGPAVTISGVAGFGASTSSPTGRDNDMFEVANNYSIQLGSHSLKMGADFIHNRVTILFPGSFYGTYAFTSLASFLSGTYLTFGQAFGKTDWFQTNPNLGWFVQDEWKVSRSLTVNAGLRHDVQWMVDPVKTRGLNFGPRVGMAWAPAGDRTVIRFGGGLFYDRIPLRAVANALRGSGVDYKAVTLQRTQLGAPVFPAKLASVPEGVLLSLSTIDPEIKNGSAIQANLEVERQLSNTLFASAGYMYVRGMHIIMQRNLNVPTLTAAQDPVNLGRPNPNFANISQYSGQGDSYYNGMTVSLEHRGGGWLAGRVSYTLSKAIDNTGNAFFSGPQDNFNIRDNRGLSDNDQRHRLTISGQLSIPAGDSGGLLRRMAGGFNLSPIFTYASAYPFNVVTGGQTIQTTAARPAGVGRNTGKGFDSSSLDVRLSRHVRLSERMNAEVMVESFNTLNRTNLQFPNNTFGTGTTPLPTFGRATNASDPRQLQFGMKLSF